MAVRVDALVKHGGRPWCHMFSDTDDMEELHAMADKIGLKRKWFQDKQKLPHYDLTAYKRALAIVHGAKEATRSEVVEVMRCRRKSHE